MWGPQRINNLIHILTTVFYIAEFGWMSKWTAIYK